MLATAVAQSPPSQGSSSGTAIERRVPTRPASPPDAPELPSAVPGSVAPEGAKFVPFVLSGVVVDGATAIDSAVFVPLYAPLIATPVTAADLAALTTAIGDAYRDAGYALANAFIPAQDIQAGVLRVHVVEGFIDSISFDGAPGSAGLVQKTMQAVTAERPLTLATLERRLMLLNDIPGVRVGDVRLHAVDVARGAYQLVIGVKPVPFDALISIDNRGTRSNGAWQAWAGGGANLLLGDGAWRLSGGALTAPASPREIRFGQVGLQRSLGSNGTLLRGSFAFSDNVAGKPLSESQVETGSLRVIIGASHPVLRSRTRSLWLNASFDIQRATEDRFGTDWFRDDLRVLRGSAFLFQADPWGGENGVNLEGSLGLDVLGASSAGIDRSRADASGRFAKLRVDAWRHQRLFGPVSAQFSMSGQAANRALLSAEEFSLGGVRYGRAFDPSELSGDRGWAGSVELRWANPLRRYERVETELFGFADTGVIWNDQPGKDPREHLSSAGVGVRVRFESWLRIAAEIGTPLNSSSNALRRQGPRAYLSLSLEY